MISDDFPIFIDSLQFASLAAIRRNVNEYIVSRS